MSETSASAAGARPPWTHPRFFTLLASLGPLRVIHQSGASTFEALCRFGAHGFAHGYMNAITDAYHWHLKLDAFGHVRSRDRTHARSGRRVLFLELSEQEGTKPFCSIYLHREKGAEFDAELEKRFLEAHAELADGRALASEDRS